MAAAAGLVITIVLAVVSGCTDNWQLIGYGPEFAARNEAPDGWHLFKNGRQPSGGVEEAVVRVAQTRQPQEVAGSDVIFIMKDRAFNYVYVVEKDGDASWLSRKTYTRYVVASSLIVAKSDRVTEFLGDADFERAVLIDAGKAESMDPVMIYDDKVHPMSISSKPVGPCAADVRVFPPDQVVGMPLAHKVVHYCSLQLLKEPPHG